MKILLGIIEKNNEEYFIFQENGTLVIKESKGFVKPANYNLIRNRNQSIGIKKEITGETVFNFRYGPVTAGTAEAGIYNIYTNGEKILGVNIDITWKRRNIEQKVIGLSPYDSLPYVESVCGNFLVSHSIAFSSAIERLMDLKLEKEIENIRIIALELERIYNHFYVIMNLASGAAQKVFTSQMQYLYEEILRINFVFSGHRFFKNFNSIGGINFKLNKKNIDDITKKLEEIKSKFSYLYEKSLESGNYLDRLHNTGIITKEHALEIGLTGPSLRASGIKEDLRFYNPSYGLTDVPSKTEGDALARMEVRAEEVFVSIDIVLNKLKNLKDIDIDYKYKDIKDISGESIGAVESPSGTIAYYVNLEEGKIKDIYIITPSTFGFKAIADSLAGQIFTDFVFTVESFGVNFADAAR